MNREQRRHPELRPAFQRVSWLPKEEQEPFTEWLCGQTRPMIPGLPMSQQDGYYEVDYDTWKRGLPVQD